MVRRRRRIVLSIAGLLVAGAVLWPGLAEALLVRDVWKRENPLVQPLAVVRVQSGQITLADGRTFRPAGIGAREAVTPEALDLALIAATAQGVVLIRDLGDGRAFFKAEPRFYNWCGTCARNYGRPFRRWAGTYHQVPLSEFLVYAGYAKAEPEQPGLTPIERWRVEGVAEAFSPGEDPTRVSETSLSFRYGGGEYFLSDFDASIELLWKPPPAQ